MVRQAETQDTNAEIAAVLRETADRLHRAGDTPFRVAAYRRAAATVDRLPRPIGLVLAEQGVAGLRQLPGIGRSLGRSIARLARTGRSSRLDRLRKADHGEALLRTLPGVGPRLATRIEETLGLGTLEELFSAAYDGRLRRVPGFGNKRLRAIRETLSTRLQAGDWVPRVAVPGPPVADLLSIDAEYREKAAAGRLPLSAPKRFNPTGGAWLPVLDTERGNRRFTAHFANTARSHETGRFRDWVVITCDTKEAAGQWTVITATFGQLRGRRLVMHREPECREHYGHRVRQKLLPLAPPDGTSPQGPSPS